MMLEVLFKWSHGIKNHVLHIGWTPIAIRITIMDHMQVSAWVLTVQCPCQEAFPRPAHGSRLSLPRPGPCDHQSPLAHATSEAGQEWRPVSAWVYIVQCQ